MTGEYRWLMDGWVTDGRVVTLVPPRHGVVTFMAVLCESGLLLYWRAKTLEVQLPSLPHV